MDERGICSKFLLDIGIKSYYEEEINQHILKCDFIGYTKKSWQIVEYKRSFVDCEKAVFQLLRYYDTLKYSKYNTTPEKYEKSFKGTPPQYYGKPYTREELEKFKDSKEITPLGKREISLYLLFDKQSQVRKFEQYHSLHKEYMMNPNCPKIDFYYLNEIGKPVKL